jgi:hypothetical protein
MKPEERELFRNTHMFQDLGDVANHFTHGVILCCGRHHEPPSRN